MKYSYYISNLQIENNVNNAANKCERTKLKCDRIQKILVNVKAGIEHLYEKLEFYRVILIYI
jgi:hypothetical protein